MMKSRLIASMAAQKFGLELAGTSLNWLKKISDFQQAFDVLTALYA